MTEMGVPRWLVTPEECAHGSQDNRVCSDVPVLQGGAVDEHQLGMNAESVFHISRYSGRIPDIVPSVL